MIKYIYKIVCECTGRVYIGQTKNFECRKYWHLYELNRNKHDNKSLQKDFNLYGDSKFDFILIECVDELDSNIRETYWINYYGGVDSSLVYNEQDSNGRSSRMRNNMRNGSLGKKLSTNSKRSIAIGHKDIEPWNKGKKMSKEFSHLQSKLNSGVNNPMYGKSTKKKYTDEFIQDLRMEYSKVQNIAELSRRRCMNESVVRCLIKYGKSYKPKEE